MHDYNSEMLCVLAAICLHASNGVPAAAVDNAEAIMRIAKERHPENVTDVTDCTDLRS